MIARMYRHRRLIWTLAVVAGVPLYVNQGLGMSVLPVRLFCPPEVTVFTLKTQ